MTDPSPRRD